jgi:hypothetical protein
MGIYASTMTHLKTSLIEIEGSGVPVNGALKILVTIGMYPKYLTL